MRKINGKVFLAMLIGVLVFTGAVFGVHHFQYQRLGKALLWQADRAEETGNIPRMADYLKRYLEFNPRDDQTKMRLARVWAGDSFRGSRRARTRALRLMDEVLRSESNTELRTQLVKLALELDNLKLAREHLEVLLPYKSIEEEARKVLPHEGGKPKVAVKQDPDKGTIEGYWGQLLQAEAKPEQAIRCCRLSILHAPQMMDSHVRLAYLLRRSKETDPEKRLEQQKEADQVIGQLVKANSSSAQAYLSRWYYRREFDLIDDVTDAEEGKVSLADAGKDVAKALELSPEGAEVLLAAADRERLRGDVVRRQYQQPIREREQIYEGHRQQAYKYLQRGITSREKAGHRSANDRVLFQLLWHKTNLLLNDLNYLEKNDALSEKEKQQRKEKRIEEIVRTIKKVRKSPLPAAGDYLEGRLLIQQRRWSEAVSRLEHARALLSRQPGLAVQVNLFLGQCYEQLEEPEQMYDAFKRVLDLDPDSVPALLGMGASHWVQGRLQEARTKYLEAMRRKERGVPPEALLDMARLEIEYQLQRDQHDWTNAEKWLNEAERRNPKKFVEVNLLRADLRLMQGSKEGGGLAKAETILQQARKKRPQEPALWTALVDLKRRQKDLPGAFALLEEAKKQLGDTVHFRLARARCLASQVKKRDRDVVREQINALAQKHSHFSDQEQARLLSGLADAQLRAGQVSDARRLWQRVANLPGFENDLRLRLLLFDLSMKLADEKGMEQMIAEIRSVEGAMGVFHRYGQALRLIWLAKLGRGNRKQLLDQARAQLQHVITRRPGWSAAYLARAEIASISGNPERMIKLLQEAVQHGETSPKVIRQLAGLLIQRNRHQEAKRALGHLRRSLLRHSELGRLAANVALHQKQFDLARELARDAIKNDSKDPRELIWLGSVLAKSGDYRQAEQKLRQAVQLAPQDPEVWVALVRFLNERGQTRVAGQEIEKARARLPEEVQLLTLGRCFQAMGYGSKTREYYEKALQSRPNDARVLRTVASFYLKTGQLIQAEPLLRKLSSGKVKAEPGDIKQARRGLAIVLSSGNNYKRFREALNLVGLRLDEKGLLEDSGSDRSDETTQDKLIRARVLATQRERQFRVRAIQILERLRGDKALTREDVFILAVLHHQEGSWARARALLQRCLANNPSPSHMVYYLRSMLREGTAVDLPEAIGWLKQLEALEKKNKVGPNGYGSVDLRARWLEKVGKGDEALAMLRQFVARPDAPKGSILLVLGSLGRQQRYAEGFKMLPEVWDEKKCPPEAAGSVSVSLMRAMKPTDEQVKQVETWIQQAIKKHPKTMILRMHLADLYDHRGRYGEAEKEYRFVLQSENEPENMVALNNLAWMLTMRERGIAEAQRLVDKAIRGVGRRADLLDTRGLIHLARGELSQAMADFREASNDNPTPTRLYHLARAHHLARDREDARKCLKKAVDLGLKLDDIHPIEQQACRKLLQEYSLTPRR